MKNKKYTLTNCYQMNESHPGKFEIPSDVEINSLQKGDCAKLIFNNKERMWVKITERNGDTFRGQLNSVPVIVNLKFNDSILFKKQHICQIYKFN